MIQLGDEERIVDLLNQNLAQDGDLLDRVFSEKFHKDEVLNLDGTISLGSGLSAMYDRLGFRLMIVWLEGNIQGFKLVKRSNFVEIYKGDGI